MHLLFGKAIDPAQQRSSIKLRSGTYSKTWLQTGMGCA
jgi:hypothetical protein